MIAKLLQQASELHKTTIQLSCVIMRGALY